MAVGIDICAVHRVEALLEHDSFVSHTFTEREREEIAAGWDSVESLAGRFACKEAVSKLLGTGFGALTLQDIEILHKPSGQPYVALSASAKQLLQQAGSDRIDLSLSHDGGFAVAVAVAFPDEGTQLAGLAWNEELNQSLLKRDRQGYKYQYGKVGILGGSQGMGGSICLASQAALRSGAGLVHALVPGALAPLCQIKLTEVIVQDLPDRGLGHFSGFSLPALRPFLTSLDALAVGPGLGRSPDLLDFLPTLFQQAQCPLVIDADGLNFLAQYPEHLDQISAPFVITPHEMEMARLAYCSRQDVRDNRLEIARDFSQRYGAIVVLKGADTVIAAGEKTYINATGNPGMATAGSGDVLSGMVAAFIGYGYELLTAVRLAVYIHGLAGDFAKVRLGEDGIIASDLIQEIPRVMKYIQEARER